MKKLLRGPAYAALGLVVLAAALALFLHCAGTPTYTPRPVWFTVDHTPEREARGRRTVVVLCAGCHKDPVTGSLSGQRMADAPPKFGAIYASNITQDREYGIGDWTDSEIAYLIRTGIARDGRYTPPWMIKLPLLADEEIDEAEYAPLVRFVRSLSTARVAAARGQ